MADADQRYKKELDKLNEQLFKLSEEKEQLAVQLRT